MIKLEKIRCEYSENPIVISEKKPRFSWIIQSNRTEVKQTRYHLQVAVIEDFSEVIWDTGVTESSESVHVVYEGPQLVSCERYYYRVKVWDNKGEESNWSKTCFFETAMFNHKEWQASFISADSEDSPDHSKGKYIRHEFSLKGKVVFARIYATALGMYNLYINGERAGDALLTPGWTNYNKRLQYQTYDVTDKIKEGTNAIGAILGCGWYKGDLAGWIGKRNIYGNRTALLLQMIVRYDDGREEWIVSNETWKSFDSPILYSELYHGEIYDARLEQQGWSLPGFDTKNWQDVHVVNHDLSIVVPQDGVNVIRQEVFKPIAFLTTPKGEKVIDFGQNMAGWIRFKVRGQAGDRVVLKHAEILDRDGNFYTDNLRTAKATIEYTLKGGETEQFEPHFTFQGFRYIKVEEYPGTIDLKNIEAVAIYSDMQQIGRFSCSNPLINQLAHNILWGLKGNFVDLPTDCPQRDERLGWTGDAQVFIRTACFLMDTSNFFKKWLRDLKSEQFEDGGIPYVIPDVLTSDFEFNGEAQETTHSSTGWGDAAVICPWTLYQCYGDRRILEEQYQSMQGWIAYIKAHAQNGLIWNTGFHFGDWVALDAKEGSYFGATPNDLTATAFYAYCVSIMAETAKVLEHEEDEKYYLNLHHAITDAFQKEFYTPNGRLAVRTQTAHILALVFNLVPEANRARTVDTLVQIIEENEGHLTTGFLGTPFICRALSENGKLEEAYNLLLKQDYPSWLYQVTKGATTIWEHWDGLKPDGTMWSEDMNSFNHYAYGAIGDWLYRVVAGLDTSMREPGYKCAVIKPHPGGGLSFAEAEYESMYGKVAVRWEMHGEIIDIVVTVPHNTTAKVVLPKRDGEVYKEHTLGSGKYRFTYKY